MCRFKIITFAICIAAAAGCAQKSTTTKTTNKPTPVRKFGEHGNLRSDDKVFAEISTREVKQKIDQGEDIIIIDVRSKQEYESGHLKNAMHIPFSQLKDRTNELNHIKETIVYSRSGFMSRVSSNILVSMGFLKVRDMAAGIQGWKFDVVK